jgi:hypothetical protein
VEMLQSQGDAPATVSWCAVSPPEVSWFSSSSIILKCSALVIGWFKN